MLVTAGPTCEDLDPVRYLTNRSSGKMGYALADAAARRGARVVLVSGPTALEAPRGRRASRGAQRPRRCTARCWRTGPQLRSSSWPPPWPTTGPRLRRRQKIKRGGERLVLELEPTLDILADVARVKGDRIVVGFAAETDHVAEHARQKLAAKAADMIVANDVTAEGAGFDHDTNVVTIFTRDGRETPLPRMGKREVAERVFDRVLELRARRAVTRRAGGPLSRAMAQDPAARRLLRTLSSEKTRSWLRYYDDIGIRLFYRDRPASGRQSRALEIPATGRDHHGETNFCGSSRQIASAAAKRPAPALPSCPGIACVARRFLKPPNASPATRSSESPPTWATARAASSTAIATRSFSAWAIRTPSWFSSGEGPGHDEDMQGIPFVGRAGKLLTQMIEAMGLRRDQVYIANVVKCRPPENRPPEKDEVTTCMPFLLRQLAAINPKVIVCLGSCRHAGVAGHQPSASRLSAASGSISAARA